MKVLMYAPIFPPLIGGPATQSSNLCRALVSRKVDVVVVTPGDRFETTHIEGYPLYRYPWTFTGVPIDKIIRWLFFLPYFLYVLAKERPDIVHCHSASASAFIAGGVTKIFRIPSILKFAGDWVWETLSTERVQGREYSNIYQSSLKARLLTRIEKFALKTFTIIWVVSNYRRENIRALLGSTDMVRTIPNALSLPRGGWHKQEPGTTIRIVSANRFIPHKRLDMLVRAFARMDVKNSELILIGDGDSREREKVEQEIHKYQLQGRVHLLGIISFEQLYREFKSASLYVSSSLEEGLPNVFIEAMHFGLPIVTMDAGGCREMVHDKENGFLVDLMDEDMLVERMRTLATDMSLRNRMAVDAVEKSRKYDLEEIVDQFIALYQELMPLR